VEGRAVVESNWLKQKVNNPNLLPAVNAAWSALIGLTAEEASALTPEKALAIRSKAEEEALTIWNELDAILRPHRIPRHFGIPPGPAPRPEPHNDFLLFKDLLGSHDVVLIKLLKQRRGKIIAVLLLHLLQEGEENREAALFAYAMLGQTSMYEEHYPMILASQRNDASRNKANETRKEVGALWKKVVRDALKNIGNITQEAKLVYIRDQHPEVLKRNPQDKDGVKESTVLSLIKKERL
jgi:hypothetical protein